MHAARLTTPTILLIDDADDTRDTLARVLRRRGYVVREAVNGALGVQELEKGRVSLVVLDLIMPDSDGWWFLEQRMKVPAFRDLPVVVFSVKPLDDAVVRGLNVTAVVQKPSADDLLDAIERYCGRPSSS